eukprot:1942034-Amphidinium_carterae.1
MRCEGASVDLSADKARSIASPSGVVQPLACQLPFCHQPHEPVPESACPNPTSGSLRCGCDHAT